MKKIRTEDEYEALIHASPAIVCDFSATWCDPCRSLEPVLDKLEKTHPEIAFVKVDVDECQDLTNMCGIRYVPTVFFVRKGRAIRKIEGWSSFETLDKLAKKLLTEH